ncbi:MAG: potassium transporter TrkG [Pseudomonadota bacterium]
MPALFSLLHVLGGVVFLFGLTLSLPLLVAWLNDEPTLHLFVKDLLFTCGAGFLLWGLFRPFRRELRIKDGFLLVALVWTGLPVFGMFPLLSYLDISVTDAYFEAVSGLTATGATVLTGLDGLPASINVWRGEMQWFGGMGVIVLAVAILPMLGIGGRQLFKAETPGPMKDTRLTPRIAQTAKGLWLIYASLTALCFAAYWAFGMGWSDALVHAFTTMGLAGFSSHDASFGYFDSQALEIIAITFMLVSGINFATHFNFLRARTFGIYVQDGEAGVFVLTVLVSGALIGVYLWDMGHYSDIGTALRFAVFNTVSVATTTGYATTDFGLWPAFTGFWMLLLGTFSTSSGSTGGGIKMIRARLLVQQLYRELRRLLHPSAQIPVRYSGATVPNQIIFAVLAFFFVFTQTAVIMTLAMMATGLEPVTAVTAVIATLSNIGPGLGQVGPATTFAVLNDFQTWLCTFAMVLGRLEMFTFLVVLTPAFWRK